MVNDIPIDKVAEVSFTSESPLYDTLQVYSDPLFDRLSMLVVTMLVMLPSGLTASCGGCNSPGISDDHAIFISLSFPPNAVQLKVAVRVKGRA